MNMNGDGETERIGWNRAIGTSVLRLKDWCDITRDTSSEIKWLMDTFKK
jgi:hypothetical protein